MRLQGMMNYDGEVKFPQKSSFFVSSGRIHSACFGGCGMALGLGIFSMAASEPMAAPELEPTVFVPDHLMLLLAI